MMRGIPSPLTPASKTPMKKTVIGYVSKTDPYHDRTAWSGTVYTVRKAIEAAGFEVIWISYGRSWLAAFYTMLLRLMNRTLFVKQPWLGTPHFSPILKAFAKNIDGNPSIGRCDYLFFPGGAQISLFMNNSKPVIYLADATIHNMIGYYFKAVNKYSRQMALDLESRASRKAAVNIRSSQWAVDSVVNDCQCDKTKCHVLEFGPNIDTKDIRQSVPYEGGELRILFSGIDWERKGGDVAVSTVEILRSKGIDAKLLVAGPQEIPVSCADKHYVEYVGYLDKNTPSDYEKYLGLYQQSHLFLLPSKAECSAIVFSEASAAGIPCYTYLTGGTGNYVLSGINGMALPEGSPADAFANHIYTDITEGRLQQFREGALRLSKERLSWEVWSKRFSDLMTTNKE